MEMTDIMRKLVKTIEEETVPALGCTELGAVAYAAAFAKEYLKEDLLKLEIKVSKYIAKNGMSVLIPNTREKGLDLVGALGFLSGKSKDGLMVLKNVNDDYLLKAKELISNKIISLEHMNNTPDVYVEVVAKGKNKVVKVILKDSHDHIYKITVNNKIVYENYILTKDDSVDFFNDLSILKIKEMIELIPIEKLNFIEDGINMNMEAARIGISEANGLQIGLTLNRLNDEGKLNMGTPMKARILTAAAADSRMGGAGCPIMSSGGSGNQGLGVILPIVVVAEDNDIDENRLLRAIFFAHAINKYVKIYTGKLSSMCGCAIAAAVGSSAAISWMLGGNDKQITGACDNVLANLTGMICDGAKESCALKLSTSADESVIASYLANENIIVESNVGIIGTDIDETIKNVGMLCENNLYNMESIVIS